MGDVEGHELGIVVKDFACFWININRIRDRVKALLLFVGLLEVEHFVFQVDKPSDFFVVHNTAAKFG